MAINKVGCLDHQPLGHSICNQTQFASSFLARLKGLLGREILNSEEALIIPRCTIVHMFGMRFSIDLVFCSGNGTVIALQKQLKPWRLSKYSPGASFAIELPVGAIERYQINLGDQLRFVERCSNSTSDNPVP